MTGAMRAGDMARLAGVSTDTLRHYERKGVLARPRRASNGYRLYPADALARVRLVRRALSVGFTLDELASILRARERGGAPCRQVRALAAEKLAELEARIHEAEALRDELRLILHAWDQRLASTSPDARAHLLETLTTTDSSTQGQPSNLVESWRRPKKKRNQNNET